MWDDQRHPETRPGRTTTDGDLDVVATWGEARAGRLGIAPGEWWSPAAAELAAALVSRGDTLGAGRRLGSDRARAGFGLQAALDDLWVLLDLLAPDSRPAADERPLVVAVSSGWASTAIDAVRRSAVVDDLSGLASAAMFEQQVELSYRRAAELGVSATALFTIVVVAVEIADLPPLARLTARVRLGEAIRCGLGSEPAAVLGPSLACLLAGSDSAEALRTRVDRRIGDDPVLAVRDRRVSLTRLPRSAPEALAYLRSLADLGTPD